MSTLLLPSVDSSFVSGFSFGALEQALESLLTEDPKQAPSTKEANDISTILMAVVSALDDIKGKGENLESSKGKGEEEGGGAQEQSDSSDSIAPEITVAFKSAASLRSSMIRPGPTVKLSRRLSVVSAHNTVPLPPPPSELCDCHGEASCPNRFASFSCGICVASFVPGPVRPYHSPNCHTHCCDDCLSETLSFMIRNGQVKQIQCPSCNYHLLPSEVARRINEGDLEKYHRFLLQKLLAASGNVHYCNNPGCENAVIVEDDCALKDWKCEGCSSTCPFCREEAHKGSCRAERRFKAAEARYKLWSAFSLSKKCPGCKTPIIKKGGCPHMTCKNPACGHQWCWHCKKDWDKHNLCVYSKILIGGLVVVSPAILAVGVGALCVVFLPLAAVGGVAGSRVYNGKALARQIWKLGRKVWNEFF